MKNDPSVGVAGGEAVAALLTLATEDCSLKERLAKAWLEHLSKIDMSKLSPDFQKRLRSMHVELREDELVHDSVDALSPEGASLLADRMVHFALDLAELAGAQSK